MSIQQQATSADLAGVGIALAAAGIYFILVGVDVVPPPGAAAGPPFVIVLAGAAFLCAAVAAMVRARAGAAAGSADLPADAPRWTDPAYRAAAIGCAGALASIGTFVAIGSGPRLFEVSTPIVEMRTAGETVGRAVFALGAVIVWIYVIALSVATVR
jgi:hypothetical protein